MAHTYHELKEKTVADLREIAKGIEHEAVEGATQMNKDHLLKALCTALGIDMHEHHEVVGVDKAAIKVKIRISGKSATRFWPPRIAVSCTAFCARFMPSNAPSAARWFKTM